MKCLMDIGGSIYSLVITHKKKKKKRSNKKMKRNSEKGKNLLFGKNYVSHVHISKDI